MAEEKKSFGSRPAGILPDRPRPNAPTVEKAVLAAILREPVTAIDTTVTIFRSEDVFYSPANREIYSVIVELGKEDASGIDLISVMQRLRERGKLDAVGGEVYLAEVEMAISTTVNLENWCQLLVKYAILRRMIDVCADSMLKCYDADLDATAVIEEIESDIFEIRNQNDSGSIVEVADIIADEIKELMAINQGKKEIGLRTGFAQLDDYTGGLKPGEMFVLAARPSIGKTSLGLNVIRNVAMKRPDRVPVAFFSLEMTEQQIARRLLCTEAGISESVFWNHSFNNSDLTKLTAAADAITGAKVFIDPTGGLTLAELRAKARRLKMTEDIKLIVIDYLQLMHADARTESRQQEVAQISGGIKKLAKDLKIPILVLAQLNREVDKNASPTARPKLAHLRESGTIEQDADVVTFLHRNRDESKGNVESTEAFWIVEKNRNGRTGELKMIFYPSRMEFVPAAPCSEEMVP